MTKIKGEEVLNYITEEDVQSRAEESLDRCLTPEELSEVGEIILGKIDEVISEAISEMTEMNELLVRNLGVETLSSHYLLYWKNENRYQKDYKVVFSALTDEDIREYIKRTREECDQHKIVFVHDGAEKLLEEINASDVELTDF